jgi:hypothetical protein
MVRTISKIYMPMANGTIKTATRKHISGRGYGTVLLNGGLGGYGGGSSYSSIDDYINTTGVDPYAGEPISMGKGIRNLSSMNSKLENLLVKSNKKNPKKEKNINFNL